MSLLLQASGFYNHNLIFYDKDKDSLEDNIRQMLYHLKYRNTNPQTLEFFLTGIDAGKRVHEINE